MLALRKFAFKKPSIFFIQAYGGTRLRLKIENWLYEQNWRQSNSPASTDILIVCGQADEGMTNAIARTQEILPLPAATVLFSEEDKHDLQADVYSSGEDIKSALEDARLHLWQDRKSSRTPIKEDDSQESNGKHDDHPNGNHGHSHKEENKPESNQGNENHSNDGHANEHEHKEQEHDHEEHDHKGHQHEGNEHNGHDHEDHEHKNHAHEGHDHQGHDHTGHDHEDHEHEKHEHDDHDHKGDDHEGHDHHDMKPGGLPMAQRGEDRDGLKLDVLLIPLGLILYAWPAGLQLNVSMQGDVIQEAEFSPLKSKEKHSSYWNEPWEKILDHKEVTVTEAETRRIMAHLDSLQRLMMVSGDESSSLLIAGLKHTAHLNKLTSEEFRIGFNKLKKRLIGGQLEKITQGIGRLTKEEAKEFGLTGPALRACGEALDKRQSSEGYADFEPVIAVGEGDARSRWHQWLAEIELSLRLIKENNNLVIKANNGQAEAPRGVLGLKEKPSAAIIKAICHLIKGQELAVARLLIASFDPDIDELL